MNNMYYFFDMASEFHFGKYRGQSFWSVIIEDKSYIYWCINNIPEFIISKRLLWQIRDLCPDFIVTSNFLNHVCQVH